jgi:hypothetical protein
MMKNLFLILVVSVFGNFANAQGYISLQCPTPTSYCDTSAANCDSMLNMAFYNVALPSVPSGDLNFVCNNSVSGGYSMTLSINWGDGTTTFHQGTGSTSPISKRGVLPYCDNLQYQWGGKFNHKLHL